MPVKIIDIDFSESEHTPQCPRLQFIMERNNRSGLSFSTHLREPHMTAGLTGHRKAEFITKNSDGLFTGNRFMMWQPMTPQKL